MKYLIVIICLFYYGTIQGQEMQTDCANTITLNQNVNNLRVYKYPEGFKAEKINDFNKVINSTPEELMSSVLSATNLDWYNYNREIRKENSSQDFDYIKDAIQETYFAELLYKVTFSANGEEYSIIKYYLHDHQKPVLGYAETMKKKGGKWVTTSEAEISQFLFFMIMVDAKYIDHIFNNTLSDNISLNDIMNSNTFNGYININNVLNELEKHLSGADDSIKSILDPNRLFK